MSPLTTNSVHRRQAIASAFRAVGLASLSGTALEARQQTERHAPISPKDNLKITKLETFLVKPRWLFLKIHTNAGITGLGEPITEGRALTCAEAVKEIEPIWSVRIRGRSANIGKPSTATRSIAVVRY